MAAVAGAVAAVDTAAPSSLIEGKGEPPVPAVAAVDEGQDGRQSLANLLRAPEMTGPPDGTKVRFYRQGVAGSKPVRRSAAQLIARTSWTAALLALGAIATARPMRAWNPSLSTFQNTVAVILVAIAVLTAVAVLTATWSSKRVGVLGPAMLGLCLGGAVVGLSIGLHVADNRGVPLALAGFASTEAPPAASAPSAPSRRPAGVAAPSVTVSLSEAARAGRDAMDRLPGWFGAATTGSAIIRIGEFPASAPLLEELRANFNARPVLVLISINNGRGQKALTIEPSTLRAEFADGRRVSALAAGEVIATSLGDAENVEAPAAKKVIRAGPGETAMIALAFLPDGTDLHDAARLTLVLNGRRVALAGSYLSPQQKADLVQRAALIANR